MGPAPQPSAQGRPTGRFAWLARIDRAKVRSVEAGESKGLPAAVIVSSGTPSRYAVALASGDVPAVIGRLRDYIQDGAGASGRREP